MENTLNTISLPTNETLDVIFLVNTTDEETWIMTSNAIQSLKESETQNKFRIILVESYQGVEKRNFDYEVDMTIYYKGDFNYNRALNLAFEEVLSDYVAVFNNDVLFMPDWYSQIRYYMGVFNLDSASPWCPVPQTGPNPQVQKAILEYPGNSVILGYDPILTFSGWGWIMKKVVLDKLRPFDEDLSFWFQDNHMCLQLKTMGLKHGAVTSSKVIHFGQKSYNQIPKDKLHSMTMGLYEKFISKWQ